MISQTMIDEIAATIDAPAPTPAPAPVQASA